jgi:hypothetical protein
MPTNRLALMSDGSEVCPVCGELLEAEFTTYAASLSGEELEQVIMESGV